MGQQVVVFHTRGETAVAALMLAPAQTAEARLMLRQWAAAVRAHDPYPAEGWCLQGEGMFDGHG